MSPMTPGRLWVKRIAVVRLRMAQYHSIGVLHVPPRRGSGYRRYGGREVIGLVQVGRLGAMRMPLPQIAQRTGGSDDVALTDALGPLHPEAAR